MDGLDLDGVHLDVAGLGRTGSGVEEAALLSPAGAEGGLARAPPRRFYLYDFANVQLCSVIL